MTDGFGWRNTLSSLVFLALPAFAGLFASAEAFAQSAECARLQAAIASAPRGGGQLQAAAERSAPSFRAQPLTPVRSAATTRSSCFSARTRRRNAARSRGRSRGCRRISRICRRAAAAARGDLIARYNAECVNAPQPAQQYFRGPVRRRRQAAAPEPSTMLPPDQQEQMIEKSIEKEKKGGATSRPAPTRSACAPATAASSPSPIRARAAAPTASRRSAGRSARTPTCALFLPVRRHDRPGRVLGRRALCRLAQRAQVPAVLRFELLLPPQGRELGAGAGRPRRPNTATSRATSW